MMHLRSFSYDWENKTKQPTWRSPGSQQNSHTSRCLGPLLRGANILWELQ